MLKGIITAWIITKQTTEDFRVENFQELKNNILKELMYFTQNQKCCQEINLGEHKFSFLFLNLNFAPLF